MANEPWDFMGVYYDAIDHFSHGFMRYYPPRRAHISEQDYQRYHGVVEAGYRFHDMMLGTLLELAPEDVTVIVCSDHGFHPDHLRPVQLPSEPAGPAIEHRDLGMPLMAGPNIKRDALIHGGSLLGITPTVLTVFGLPVEDDMDGKPLLDAFETPPERVSIPSWDQVPGDAARLSDEQHCDSIAAKEAMDQLVALGYVEAPGETASRPSPIRSGRCATIWPAPTWTADSMPRPARSCRNSTTCSRNNTVSACNWPCACAPKARSRRCAPWWNA
jgi:hypothetical protein